MAEYKFGEQFTSEGSHGIHLIGASQRRQVNQQRITGDGTEGERVGANSQSRFRTAMEGIGKTGSCDFTDAMNAYALLMQDPQTIDEAHDIYRGLQKAVPVFELPQLFAAHLSSEAVAKRTANT